MKRKVGTHWNEYTHGDLNTREQNTSARKDALTRGRERYRTQGRSMNKGNLTASRNITNYLRYF